MPTYYATGVTASLSAGDLRRTLSDNLHLRPGDTQRAHESRVQSALAAADRLPERPLHINEREKGAIQFIGPDGDLPFYMVEAGNLQESAAPAIDADDVMQDAFESQPLGGTSHTFYSDDSPLTSLATTPTPTRRAFTSPSSPQGLLFLPKSTEPAHEYRPTPSNNAVFTTNPVHHSKTQALVLDIHFEQKSFLLDIQSSHTTRGLHKGLKIEVLVNGQLADVCFVSANLDRRKASRLVKNEKVSFAGLRIHRQVEKPWVYFKRGHETLQATKTAQTMWSFIRAAYTEEAALRGSDTMGIPQPSAGFLKAVAELDVPDSLKACTGIGIIDVVITVGEGRKDGPGTPYILSPQRLDDRGSRKLPPMYQSTEAESRHSLSAGTDPTTMSNIPDFTTQVDNEIVSSKKGADLAADLDMDLDDEKFIIGHFENARGSVGKVGRTLRQRLGDVKKMNEENQATAIEQLKEEFGAQRVFKKARLDPKLELDFETSLTASETRSVNGAGRKFDSSRGEFLQREPSAEGHDSLVTPRRLSTWRHTTGGVTKASSLAHSPVSTPVKPPKPRGSASTPQKSENHIEKTMNPTALEPGQPPPQQSMTLPRATDAQEAHDGHANEHPAAKGKLKEETVEGAIAAFQVPAACTGSCVGYDADEKIVRQISKARSGEFKEHSLLVGMRFVVL